MFNPEPVAAFFDAILIGEGEDAVGEIVAVEADGFTVVCADGRFKVTRVQPDGAKKIDASEWTKSANVAVGARFA